jgi:hypothetical protein
LVTCDYATATAVHCNVGSCSLQYVWYVTIKRLRQYTSMILIVCNILCILRICIYIYIHVCVYMYVIMQRLQISIFLCWLLLFTVCMICAYVTAAAVYVNAPYSMYDMWLCNDFQAIYFYVGSCSL